MPKLKAGHISPSQEEDAAINAGIAADDDTREVDDAWFAKAKPASEAFKSTGNDRQAGMNAAFRQFVAEHPIDR